MLLTSTALQLAGVDKLREPPRDFEAFKKWIGQSPQHYEEFMLAAAFDFAIDMHGQDLMASGRLPKVE